MKSSLDALYIFIIVTCHMSYFRLKIHKAQHIFYLNQFVSCQIGLLFIYKGL